MFFLRLTKVLLKFLPIVFLYSNYCYSENSYNYPLKNQNYLVEGVTKYEMLVKFLPEARVDLGKRSQIQFLDPSQNFAPSKINKLIKKYQISFTRILDFSSEELQSYRNLVSYKEKGFDKLKFAGFFKTNFLANHAPKTLLHISKELELLPEVDYVELSPVKKPTMNHISPDAKPTIDELWNTPDYSNKQGYQRSNPGVDVDYAVSLGLDGTDIHLNDVEYDWGDLKHEEFIGQNIEYGLPRKKNQWLEHGIAVIGILIANAENNFGIKGATPKAKMSVWAETYGRAKAILSATEKNKAGDIIILEMQTGGPDNKLAPPDLNQSVWDAVKTATDAGILIVSAAGNGSANLDSSPYKPYRDRGDNGAIIVGAGSPDSRHDKLGYSTYGKRVNLQGWGSKVFTTGYNNVKGADDSYTSSFGGTSSATPIVTQAVALIQDCAKRKGSSLKPREMRKLLVDTGIRQGSGGTIGPIPNIKAAIKKLGGCS